MDFRTFSIGPQAVRGLPHRDAEQEFRSPVQIAVLPDALTRIRLLEEGSARIVVHELERSAFEWSISADTR